MRKIIVDVDYTISFKKDSYEKAIPHEAMIKKLQELKKHGFWIVLFSARNMKTYNGNIELIEEFTRPILLDWLYKYDVPFDELILGKPWNDEGYYIDDNAVRPKEFLTMSHDEIMEMLDKERAEQWKL